MADLDALLQCTYGSAAFQLADYTYSEEPIMQDGVGRVGTKKTVSGKGWIEGTDPADFASKLADARAGFRVVARDFRVIGLGGTTEVEILAAYCRDFGPHVAFKLAEQGSGTALKKDVEFTVTGVLAFDEAGSGGIGGVSDGFGVSVDVKSDGLRRVARKGFVSQSGAAEIYQGTVLPAILAAYPATKWVSAQKYEVNSTNTYLTYEISFEELQVPFITDPQFVVLDGDLIHRVERDEQHRTVITITFDLAYTGSFAHILTTLRPDDEVILRERWEDQTYKDRRLRGEIVYVRSADHNDLGAWEQTLEVEDESPALSSFVVPGRDPVLYYGAQPTRRAVQAGRAIGFGRFVKYAPTIWPARLAAPRKLTFRRLNDAEYETTWRYEYVFSNGVSLTAAVYASLNRPAVVEFLTAEVP